jgi:hypothetical protein
VSTLVPARLRTIALTVGAGLLAAIACLAFEAGTSTIPPRFLGEHAGRVRLDAAGSVGGWLASINLVAAGATALFIFSLRRHRIDDYHARYRIWLWIAAACVAASLVETTSVGALLRAACRWTAETTSLRSEVLWPAGLGLVGAAIGMRLYFEMRKCPWTIMMLVACALCFGVAAAAAWHRGDGAADGKWLLARGGWLTGHVLVVATFLLYSRYVQLDLTGRIDARNRRKESSGTSGTAEEQQSGHAAAKPTLRLRTDLDPVESHAVAAARSEDVMPPARHLSKAERRKLRRESRMAS